MKQSRKMSLLETFVSTAVGFALSYVILWTLADYYGWQNNHAMNTVNVGIFTIASLFRGYLIRRLFNLFGAEQESSSKIEGATCTICDARAGHYRDCPLYRGL